MIINHNSYDDIAEEEEPPKNKKSDDENDERMTADIETLRNSHFEENEIHDKLAPHYKSPHVNINSDEENSDITSDNEDEDNEEIVTEEKEEE
jgi:hypothetical protein